MVEGIVNGWMNEGMVKDQLKDFPTAFFFIKVHIQDDPPFSIRLKFDFAKS